MIGWDSGIVDLILLETVRVAEICWDVKNKST